MSVAALLLRGIISESRGLRRRALTHLGLPAEYPKFRPALQASLYEHACGPRDEDCQLNPKGALYEIIEPAPADD